MHTSRTPKVGPRSGVLHITPNDGGDALAAARDSSQCVVQTSKQLYVVHPPNLV